MARYIAPEVDELVSEREAGDTHRIVLTVDDGELATLVERADEYGVSIVSKVEPNVLVVDITTDQIEDFCRPSYVQSVTLDNGMKVADSGNLSLHQA